MTIFDILKGIIFKKDPHLLDNVDDAKAFQPFLVNRWLSMHSGTDARIVNETVNKFGHVFNNKADLYKFMVNIFPEHRFKRISYIKKVKDIVA